MTLLVAALAGLAVQAAEPNWTWSLYDTEGPVVLANDVPDTARLRATLECRRGSGVVRAAAYVVVASYGLGSLKAGSATAATEIEQGRRGEMAATLRTDHPVFAAFVQSGRLTLAVGSNERDIEVPSAHIAKLRRFAELCGG